MSDGDSEDAEIEIEIEVERGTVRESDRHRSTADVVDRPDRPGERPLEDELGRIDVRTTPEGHVESRVTDLWSADETTVGLEVTLPHGETTTFTLEKPIPWSTEFLLARIVEDVGYDASSVGQLVGEPIYVARTDAGPTAEERSGDWWTTAMRTSGNAVLSALGGRYRLEDARGPEWRLVDPPERAPEEEEGLSEEAVARISSLLVVLGVLLAAAGAILGETGALAVSSTAVGYALPGIVLALVGLHLASRGTDEAG